MAANGSVKARKKRVCKDCRSLPDPPSEGDPDPDVAYRPKVDRPAPHPGPRCTTCKNARVKELRKRAHEARVIKIYELEPGAYDRLYILQGGVCYICERANGATKRLAVDHNHDTGEVRGLLCGPCNQGVIGHLRHDVEALLRAIEYLENPPARRLLSSSA